MDAHLLLLCWI